MTTWKPVVGFERYYEVSDEGKIRRIAPAIGAKVGRIRKATPLKGRGYMMLWLMGDKGQKKFMRVATIVCEAFHGKRPDGMQVNHKNGIHDDDRADNLEWMTPSQNTRHRFEVLGQHNLRGQDHPNSKLTEYQVQLIRTLDQKGCVASAISKQIGISIQVVKSITANINWKWLPFVSVDPLPAKYKIITEIERRARGSKNHNAKLTERQVKVIKRRLARGDQMSLIARDYAVTVQAIFNIKAGKVWAHVQL